MKKRFLITPLDWGLGHATRCIPIIRSLVAMRAEVHVGGSGSSLELLKQEFSNLTFHQLPSYNPVYPVKGSRMAWKMALQLPHFIKTISEEHRWIEELVHEHTIDFVISDNRYGCWSAKATSVFITHQSNIIMPKRFGFLSPWVRKTNQSLVQKFDLCWIPDYPSDTSLAGELIDFGSTRFHRQTRYVGALSRFTRTEMLQKKYDVVALCSGPEPQRTHLEVLLRNQLKNSGLTFILARGIFRDVREEDIAGNGTVVDFLTSEQLQQLLPETDVVVARSGYSTVMDMNILGGKAIFIPTPGQTEQEYLALRLRDKGIAFFMDQENFNLQQALKELPKYSGFCGEPVPGLLDKALEELMTWK